MDYNEFGGEQRVHVDDLLKKRIRRGKYIVGPAGSGKTEIMCYCAEELAKQGKKVLIAFFNKSLGKYCREKAPHAICCNYHKVPAIAKALFDIRSDDFNSKEGCSLPGLEQKAEYDYIFVDEAQDYKPNWFGNLHSLLNRGGIFCVSADPYQKIYDRPLVQDTNPDYPNFLVPSLTGKGLGFNGRWVHLNKIYRSNSMIQELACEFAKKHLKDTYGSHDFVFGKDRESSEIHLVDGLSGGLERNVLDLVRWLERSGKNLDRTAFIAYTNPQVAKIYNILKDNRYISDDYRAAKNTTHCETGSSSKKNDECKERFDIGVPQVKVASIHSFKGLDIDNVVLFFSGEDRRVTDEILYTSLTRAKKNLYIINPGDASREVADKLRDIYGKFEEQPRVVTG